MNIATCEFPNLGRAGFSVAVSEKAGSSPGFRPVRNDKGYFCGQKKPHSCEWGFEFTDS
jgi:hypothetical protein